MNLSAVPAVCWMAAACCLGCVSGAYAAADWQVEKRPDFHVYYREVPADFVRAVLDDAEEDYRRVAENLGDYHAGSALRDRPVAIYIYRDQADYLRNAEEAAWSHGAAAFLSRTVRTYPADNGFFDSLLPHELGHILLHDYLGERADIPAWFDEGVAMYQERARRMGAHEDVRAAIKNDQFIPLTRLADMRLYKDTKEADVRLYYAESASAVNFLITQMGQQRFVQLCRALRDGMLFRAALAKVYPRLPDLDAFNTQWKRYLEGQ